MSQDSSLQIPKKRQKVTLWVYPDGKVVGSLFLSHQSMNSWRAEEPLDILNRDASFVIVQCEAPDEIRFYNIASIVRVEYEDDDPAASDHMAPLPCRLYMMDDSLIEATIKRDCSPDNARLYDNLNVEHEHFVKVHIEDGNICLVNKSYIVRGVGLQEIEPDIPGRAGTFESQEV